MIVYISGPMSGYVNDNRDAFFAAEERLSAAGYRVVNSAALDGEGTRGWSHADYLKRDIALLLDCDLIYMLPGWRYSKGALVENHVARTCGIFELHDPDLEIWRGFEGEPLAAAKESPALELFGEGLSSLRAEDPSVYRLEEVTAPRAGDEFPDVGYVRRMTALAEPKEPTAWEQHSGGQVLNLHIEVDPEIDAEFADIVHRSLHLLRGGRSA